MESDEKFEGEAECTYEGEVEGKYEGDVYKMNERGGGKRWGNWRENMSDAWKASMIVR